MSEQEKKQSDKLIEMFKKMDEEQRRLWLAVADGMLIAQDIFERKAS